MKKTFYAFLTLISFYPAMLNSVKIANNTSEEITVDNIYTISGEEVDFLPIVIKSNEETEVRDVASLNILIKNKPKFTVAHLTDKTKISISGSNGKDYSITRSVS